jgi:hypothetical protein
LRLRDKLKPLVHKNTLKGRAFDGFIEKSYISFATLAATDVATREQAELREFCIAQVHSAPSTLTSFRRNNDDAENS